MIDMPKLASGRLRKQWKFDPAKCVGCGDCASLCPASVFSSNIPPCRSACPLLSDIPDYLSLIRQQRLDYTYSSIIWSNPFPGITGRVCTHPCEGKCLRGQIDEPVSIQVLERFVADQWLDSMPRDSVKTRRGKRVAIIGSGPAGLIAAHDLALKNYRVTIFDSLPVPGGLLSVGIPSYRLPKNLVKDAVARVTGLGVVIKLNVTIGEDVSLQNLLDSGFEALLLAIGAQQSVKLQISGEDQAVGLIDGLSFLRSVSLGNLSSIKGKAIIIGGGNAAIDSARSMIRLGASEVRLVYRRTREEMSAIPSDVADAEAEGVSIRCQAIPTRLLTKNDKVVAIEFVKTNSRAPDNDGQPSLVPIPGSEFTVEADCVISAIGQKPDLSFLTLERGVTISESGFLETNLDLSTHRQGLFAAGDAVIGPSSVIESLASGRRAATSIDRYLTGKEKKEETGYNSPDAITLQELKNKWLRNLKNTARRSEDCLEYSKRISSFKEVKLGLSASSAINEASRCLKCGLFADMKIESCCHASCRICEYICPQNAIRAY